MEQQAELFESTFTREVIQNIKDAENGLFEEIAVTAEENEIPEELKPKKKFEFSEEKETEEKDKDKEPEKEPEKNTFQKAEKQTRGAFKSLGKGGAQITDVLLGKVLCPYVANEEIFSDKFAASNDEMKALEEAFGEMFNEMNVGELPAWGQVLISVFMMYSWRVGEAFKVRKDKEKIKRLEKENQELRSIIIEDSQKEKIDLASKISEKLSSQVKNKMKGYDLSNENLKESFKDRGRYDIDENNFFTYSEDGKYLKKSERSDLCPDAILQMIADKRTNREIKKIIKGGSNA